jgi:hypothetical protein
MKYTIVPKGTKNSLRLQGVGIVAGVPASELKEGDLIMWNFGSVYEVGKFREGTAKTVVFETTPKGGVKAYIQKLRKSRLACRLS